MFSSYENHYLQPLHVFLSHSCVALFMWITQPHPSNSSCLNSSYSIELVKRELAFGWREWTVPGSLRLVSPVSNLLCIGPRSRNFHQEKKVPPIIRQKLVSWVDTFSDPVELSLVPMQNRKTSDSPSVGCWYFSASVSSSSVRLGWNDFESVISFTWNNGHKCADLAYSSVKTLLLLYLNFDNKYYTVSCPC